MKLALLIEHFSTGLGGAKGSAVAVARALAARGHKLVVYAEHGSSIDGIDVQIGPLAAAPRQIIAWQPDLVIDWGLHAPAHIHRLDVGTHRECLRLSLQRQPLWLHWLQRIDANMFPRQRRICRREQLLLAGPGARFLAASEFVKSQVHRTVPVAADRVKVLPNGVELQRFAPELIRPRWRSATRTELGIAEHDVAFLLVGNDLSLANFDLLARLFSRIHPQLPQARLIVLGNRRPPRPAAWLTYAAATTQPEQYYAAADALLHPSWYDAGASVVLEAMAAGLPVVASDHNGSAEALEPGSTGFILPISGGRASVATAWQHSIAALAQSSNLRQNLGTAARTAAQAHGMASYIAKFETYLQGALPHKLAMRS